MFTKSPILLPTDFSDYARHAQEYAVALAVEFGGFIHMAHVLDVSVMNTAGRGLRLTKAREEELTDTLARGADERLRELASLAESAGVKVERHLVRGKPASEIVRLAKELACGLIVTSTHGRTGFDHMVFGSVADRVVRDSPIPVLSVKKISGGEDGSHVEGFRIRKVLFPTDFSEQASRALPYAASICREFEASLVLQHVSEVPVILPEFMPDAAMTVGADMEVHAQEGLQRLADQMEGIQTEVLVTTGIPYREICHAVTEAQADLVVLPTHGRSGLVHALFGSVAEKVVRLAPCPVLTIRPENLDAADVDKA